MSNNPYANTYESGGYFYNAIRRDIRMIKNDTLSFGFQLQGLGDQEPESIVFTCKETPEDTDPLFSVSLEDTIDIREYDEDKDIYTIGVRIPPRLTEDIDLGRYYYDLQVSVNGDIITLMKGRLTVEYQIS